MKRSAPQLHARRRAVTVDGKEHLLHEKSWQVLQILMEAAPDVVPRDRFVAGLWGDNLLTGEKGLNQAIWNLRRVLEDDPRAPQFIRTVPRVGYRWIGPAPQPAQRPRWRIAAGIAAALAVFVVSVAYQAPERTATNAYRVGLDVHVEFDDGVVGVLRNANQAEIGAPVLSADGQDVVVPVFEDRGCRLVIVNLVTHERQDFNDCPTSTST